MNKKLKEALSVMVDFYVTDFENDAFGVAQTPGYLPESVMEAWRVVKDTAQPGQEPNE